jgi:hypothetical protein
MAENKPVSPKSILIFVIILFILIASLSVASYLSSVKNIPPVVVQPTEEPIATPTPEPTIAPTLNIDMSNWQTYKNDKYGFEVRHPSDWSVSESLEDDQDPAVVVSLVSPSKKGYILGPYLPSKFAPKNWEEVNSFIAPKISIQGAVKNEITFNGHKAYEVINRPGDRNEMHEIYFLYNGYFFILQSSAISQRPEPLLNQVVSTFRFMK